MEVKFGDGKTEYGPGIEINLTGDEVALAIESYLFSHGVYVGGSRTISVNDELCNYGKVYVDPSGYVMNNGMRYFGSGRIVE